MKELTSKLEQLVKNTNGDQATIKNILQEKTLYPFSTESKLLAYFLSIGELNFSDYTNINNEYNSRNKYLDLFDMAPRTFGQTWGEQHIHSLIPAFTKATKESLSSLLPNFDGEFDLWYKGIRIEVKACRANNKKTSNSLASRAYLHSEAALANFKYHFQQLKPSCCDIFIFIGACRDKLLYWILTSDELKQTGKLGPQHRNEQTGKNKNVFEGQVFMTEDELKPFAVSEKDILETICKKMNIV